MRKAKILTFILALTLVFSMAINASAATNLAKGATIVDFSHTVNAATEGPERILEDDKVTELGPQEGWTADKDAQIGLYLTKWCATDEAKAPHWVIIDLGAEKTFDKISLATGAAAARDWDKTTYAAYAFELSVSNSPDGNWTPFLTVTDNTEKETERSFSATTGRYVKLVINTPTQPGESNKSIRVANLSIFEVVAATTTPQTETPTEAPTQAPTQAPTSAPTSGGNSGKESANTADGFTFVYIALAVLAMGAVVTISRTRKNNA